MKYFLGLSLIIFSSTANCQTDPFNPFDTLKFDKVVMYDFNDEGQEEIRIVDKNGKLDNSVTKQKELDKETIHELNRRLGIKSSYVQEALFCYNPHLGFVYYKKGIVVASVTVCLQCSKLDSSIIIPAQVIDKIEDQSGTYYQIGGMSKSLWDYMNHLVKTHKFSHGVN